MAKAGNVAEIVFLDQPLDSVETQCLILPFFSNEKPLKGYAGFADWRLNGKISRDRMGERIKGDPLEIILIPSAHRLNAKNLLLVGWGEVSAFDRKFYLRSLSAIENLLQKNHLTDFVLGLNPLGPIAEEVMFLGEYLMQALPKGEHMASWKVLAPSPALAGCMEVVQKNFHGKISCQLKEATLEKSSKKPFTLR